MKLMKIIAIQDCETRCNNSNDYEIIVKKKYLETQLCKSIKILFRTFHQK